MVRIAPVSLSFNPKTLWFDAGDFELSVGDAVVVSTTRGKEFGHVSKAVFDMDYEKTKKLKSPLKPVERLATDEDAARADEMAELSRAALPVFREMAADYAPNMNPIAVEYLFSGEKAVFYFDSEERVDFRDLVRKLAAELHVRVDMKQIGVRDGARMVGGIGHCGQELCCARLGGNFNPVSIRMAKEQDLSLNPQKISGLCGRLMCCLRYEFDAYKDFHGRAPKKNARVSTPDGEGKVVDLDVPREVVSIKVGDEKPVKVPLAEMERPEEDARPNAVGEEAWERAQAPAALGILASSDLFASQLSGEDKLAEPGKVGRMPGGDQGKGAGSGSHRRRRRRGGGASASQPKGVGERQQQKRPQQQRQQQEPQQRKRRRSTKVSSEGGARAAGQSGQAEQKKSVQVGRNSSALRASRDEKRNPPQNPSQGSSGGGRARRRRRSHKPGTSGGADKGNDE